MPAEPNAPGHWRPHLAHLSGTEQIELRSELDEILARPAMGKLRELLIGSHDELVRQLTEGPLMPPYVMARRVGLCAGLKGLESLISDIRKAADQAETKMIAQLEQLSDREEVRA